jgi:hypothetical protein
MNDPHVEYLYYDIGTDSESISYKDPPPLTFENKVGRFELKDGQLSVFPKDHFPNEQSARDIVSPFLRAWEVHTDLTANLGQIRFTYRNAKIIDRNPPENGVIIQGTAASVVAVGCRATVQVTCQSYPDPPDNFATTSDVELAFARWLQFREGKEPLQSMSYFVFTLLEGNAGGLKQAAETYQISRKVLVKIRELSSKKGDAKTARKADFIEMSGAEKAWLAAAVRSVVLQLGQYAAGKPLDRITLSDLPPLKQ